MWWVKPSPPPAPPQPSAEDAAPAGATPKKIAATHSTAADALAAALSAGLSTPDKKLRIQGGPIDPGQQVVTVDSPSKALEPLVVSGIANLKSDISRRHGHAIAVDSNYICYGLKAGQVGHAPIGFATLGGWRPWGPFMGRGSVLPSLPLPARKVLPCTAQSQPPPPHEQVRARSSRRAPALDRKAATRYRKLGADGVPHAPASCAGLPACGTHALRRPPPDPRAQPPHRLQGAAQGARRAPRGPALLAPLCGARAPRLRGHKRPGAARRGSNQQPKGLEQLHPSPGC
jgi:hypothetical protein